jgi:hypothetical protein
MRALLWTPRKLYPLMDTVCGAAVSRYTSRMSLQQKIRADMIAALKDRNEVRLTTLRSLLSAFTNELVAHKQKPDSQLPDEDVLAVIKRAVKQRQDSIEQFTNGGRDDLAKREETELAILKEYLPEQAGEEEITKVAREKIAEMGGPDSAKAGILVGAVMKEFKGNADGAVVKRVVESLLS